MTSMPVSTTMSDPTVAAAAVVDDGPMISGVIWFLVFLSGAFYFARLYGIQFLSRTGVWWDDWITLTAWLLLVVDAVVMSASQRYGYGQSESSIEPRRYRAILLCELVASSLIFVASAMAKNSYMLTLLRTTECCAKEIMWVLLVTMNTMFPLAIVFMWVDCQPFASRYDLLVDNRCTRSHWMVSFIVAAFAYSSFIDIILGLMSCRLAMRIDVKGKEWLGLGIGVCFASVACVSSAIKAKIEWNMHGKDRFHNGATFTVLSANEVAMLIIASSFPMLRFLVPSMRSKKYRSFGIRVTCNAFGNCKTERTMDEKPVDENTGKLCGKPTATTNTAELPVQKQKGKDGAIHKGPGARADEIDAGSDKSILGRAPSPVADPNGIVTYQEVKVEYVARARSDDDKFEMDEV